jgi:hypothetical protein
LEKLVVRKAGNWKIQGYQLMCLGKKYETKRINFKEKEIKMKRR